MDQATHLISGIIQGKYFEKKTEFKRILWLCVIGALIPDIDIVAYLVDKREYLIHHRALSHSLITTLFWTVFICFLLYGRSFMRVKVFKHVIIASFFSLLGHLYLDLFTSYGTALLSPFSDKRFSLDALFIVDPIYWALLFSAFFISKLRKLPSKRLYLVLLIIWFFYPILCLTTKLQVEQRLQIENNNKELKVLPDFLSPIYWKVIENKDRKFIVLSYNIVKNKSTYVGTFSALKCEDMSELEGKDRFLRFYFENFLRFPVCESVSGLLKIQDLRFYPTAELWNSIRNKYVPFTVVLYVTGQKIQWYTLDGKTYPPK